MTNRIREFRKAAKLTQLQLTEMVGFSRYQILQAYESGRYVPGVDVAIRIARALNTTVEELFILDTFPDEK